MTKSLESEPDYSLTTARMFVIDMKKLRRVQMAREAASGHRPPIPQLIHEAVKAMSEP